MASHEARRGRPKGSGLDDRSQLARIADMLARDPSLKPTTAIKAIGVSDPSTIRRLREKLKVSAPQPTAAEPVFCAQSALPAGGSAAAAGCPSAPAREMRTPMSAAPAGAENTEDTSWAPGSAGPAEKDAWFTQWCALGLSAVSSTLEAQMALINDLLHTPQVESALRQQILLNEVAKALCPKRSDMRTFH